MSLSMEEARKAMIAKRFGGNPNGARTGGAGSQRNKSKGNVIKGGDDKKLSGVLKKMQMTPLKGVEEVNIFKNDGSVIHIVQPKIEASIPCNTYVVSGSAETKNLTDLLPGILTQLGPESVERLRQYAAAIGAAGAGANANGTIKEENEDDDVPELVENFEEAAAKKE
jgi:nascent polypeptide-associated complex subunit beta